MHSVSFTGTSKNITKKQHQILNDQLKKLFQIGAEFHHGDCIGADKIAHALSKEIGYWLVCHPPTDESKRAFTENNVTLPAKEYMSRNDDIVNAGQILLATPANMKETLRSGTWATVRRAVKKGIPVIIIYPDGSIEQRSGKK